MRILACIVVVALAAPSAWTQEAIEQSMTLKGIRALTVRAGSIMPEADALGLGADSLEMMISTVLRERQVPLVDTARAILRCDVVGFEFGGRISYAVRVALWQPAVLLASGQNTLAATWSGRRESEAKETDFVQDCHRALRSLLDEFLEDLTNANRRP